MSVLDPTRLVSRIAAFKTRMEVDNAMQEDEERRKKALAESLQRKMQVAAPMGRAPDTGTPEYETWRSAMINRGQSIPFTPDLPGAALGGLEIGAGLMNASPLQAIPGYNRIPSVIRNPLTTVTAPGMYLGAGGLGAGAKLVGTMAAGQLAGGLTGRAIGGETGEEIGGMAGMVAGPLSPMALKGATRLAQTVTPLARAKAAEYGPALREAVGSEAGRIGKVARNPATEMVTGDDLETLIANKARAADTALEFPDPMVTPPEQLAAALGQEVERIKTNAQPTLAHKARLAVREFFNPKSPEGRSLIDQEVLQHATTKRRGDSIAKKFEEWELSTRQRYFPTNDADEILTIPEGVGLSRNYNDVMENPSQYAQWLSPEQLSVAKRRGATFEALATKFEEVTGEKFPRSYFRNNAEAYSPRDVIKDSTGREATALSSPFEERRFLTQAEGEAEGFVYSTNSPRAVRVAVAKVYNRIADEVMAREYASMIGKKPIEYVNPELITNVKGAAAAEKATLGRVTTEMQHDRAVQEAVVADIEKKMGWAKTGRSADLAPLKRNVVKAQRRWANMTTPARKTGALEEYRNAQTVYKNAQAQVTTRLQNDLAEARVALAETPKPSTAAIRAHADVVAAHGETRRVSANLSAARKSAEKAPTGYERVTMDRVGQNRIYPTEISRAIKERYGVPETPSIYKTAASVTTAPLRFAKTGFDFGVGLVHGYSPLLTHPNPWGKGVGLGLKRVIRDAGGKARYIEENKTVIREMIEQDWFPRSAIREFALPVPEKIGKVSKVAGTVVKNIEGWFSDPLDIMSVEIYKQGKELYGITGGDVAKMKELVDSLIPMTGTVRHAGGPNEGRALFAANFVRALSNLSVNAMKPGIVGTEARRLFRNIFLLGGLATVGINEAMGRKWTLDLRDGKAFTVRLGNQDVSLLGPWAPLFRGVAKAVTGDPLYLLTRTARGKVAPGAPQWIIDILSKSDFMGNPLDVTNPEQMGKYAAGQMLPIGPGQAAQTFEGIDWTSPKAIASAAVGAVISVAGGRMNPESAAEIRNRRAMNDPQFGKSYDELDRQGKLDYKAKYPDDFATSEELPEGTPIQRMVELSEERAKRLGAIGEKYNQDHDGGAYIYARGEILSDIATRQDEVSRNEDYKPKTDQEKAVNDWNKMIADAKNTAVGGVLTGEDFGKLEDQAAETLGPDKWKLVQDWRMATADPVEKHYLEDRPKMEGYFNLEDELWAKLVTNNPKATTNLKQYATYRDYIDAVGADMEAKDRARENAYLDPVSKEFEKRMSGYSKGFLLKNPEVDALRAIWGYSQGVHSSKAQDFYFERTGMKAREISG